ncbi:MAG: hypothetical protein HW406_604 [Candidatus Brocadiaceae bacterium]|nr:hypothetical protein [Candidatus Brocadiaceae bacterium]
MFLGLKPWVAHPVKAAVNRVKHSNSITIYLISDNPFRFMKVKILTEIIIFYKHFVQGIKIRPSATTDYPRNTRKARNICYLGGFFNVARTEVRATIATLNFLNVYRKNC